MLGQVCLSKKEEENIFFQPTEPLIKDGIWFDTSVTGSPELDGFRYEGIEVCDDDFIYTDEVEIDYEYKPDLLNVTNNASASAAIGKFVYLLRSYTMEKYDTETGELTILSTIPDGSGLNDAIGNMVAVGTDIYFYTNKIIKYDTLTDTYTFLGSIPDDSYKSTISYTLVAVGTDIYIYKYRTSDVVPSDYTKVRKYDTTNNSYTNVSDFPGELRTNPRLVYKNGYIYILGDAHTSSSYYSSQSYWYGVYAYDIANDTYTRKTDLPTYVTSITAVVLIGSMFYIFGLRGYGDSNYTDVCKTNDFSSYTVQKNIPYRCYAKTVVLCNYNIYFFGLWDYSGGKYYYNKVLTVKFYKNVNYKPDNSLAFGIYSFIDAVSVGDFVYYFGARKSSSDTATYAYKINIYTKSVTTLANMPDTFTAIKSVVVGGDIYLACTTNNHNSSLYKYNIDINTYTLVANFGSYYNLSGGVIGTDIYISPSNQIGTSTEPGFIYKYDTLTDTLTTISTERIDTSYNVISTVGNYVYMFRERTTSGTSNYKIYKYDTVNNIFEVAGTTPYSVYSSTRILSIDKYIYLFGLYYSGSSSSETYERRVYRYDTETQMTVHLNDIPNNINNGLKVVYINNSIYIVDGINMYKYYIKSNKAIQSKRIYISTDYIANVIKLSEKFNVGIKDVRLPIGGTLEKYKTYLGDGTSWSELFL